MYFLTDIFVLVRCSSNTSKEILINKDVDATFDSVDTRVKSSRELLKDILDETSMVVDLSHLHDPNNACLDFQLSTLLDLTLCFGISFVVFWLWKVDVDINIDPVVLETMVELKECIGS